jgi:hypothetical protein
VGGYPAAAAAAAAALVRGGDADDEDASDDDDDHDDSSRAIAIVLTAIDVVAAPVRGSGLMITIARAKERCRF